MAGMIPQSFINGLLERTDPVDVIGRRVQLRKTGDHHTGLCPFHQEKTPSFHVYPDHYHCFGCGAHGTALGFLMEIDGLTFPEAVEALAEMAGLEVPRERATGPRIDSSVYDTLEAAADRYRGWLGEGTEGTKARAYLNERGLGAEVIDRFGVGFAPAGWDRLKTALRTLGEGRLVEAGLVAKSDRGHTYDRFRDRIVFPIRNTRGRVIGFGGRVFGTASTDGPKYLNSPDTPHFSKGQELYGLYEARQTPRRLDSVIVVEGYMDVLALAEHGIDNAVATLGTAIGKAHFEKLFKRHINLVTCCFDGDDAGRSAAWKAVEAAFPALSAGRQLHFAFLPDDEDPDSLVRRHGRALFTEKIENATPVATYFLKELCAGVDLGAVDGRALLRDLALPRLAVLPAGALREVLVADLAHLCRISEQQLEQALRDHALPSRDSQLQRTAQPSKLGNHLLQVLVKHPAALYCLDDATRERLASATADGSLLGVVVAYLAEQPDADTATLLGRFIGEDAHEQLAKIASAPSLLSADALAAEFTEGIPRFLGEREQHANASLVREVQESHSTDALRKVANAAQNRERRLRSRNSM